MATIKKIASSDNSTNATSAKTTAGNIFKAFGYNTNAAARYLKLYDKSGTPSVGSDIPIATLYLPPAASFLFDFGSIACASGIALAFTIGPLDDNTQVILAGDIVGFNLVYA